MEVVVFFQLSDALIHKHPQTHNIHYTSAFAEAPTVHREHKEKNKAGLDLKVDFFFFFF